MYHEAVHAHQPRFYSSCGDIVSLNHSKNGKLYFAKNRYILYLCIISGTFHSDGTAENFRTIMQVGGQFRTQNVAEVVCLRGQAFSTIHHRTQAKRVWLSLHSGSLREGE